MFIYIFIAIFSQGSDSGQSWPSCFILKSVSCNVYNYKETKELVFTIKTFFILIKNIYWDLFEKTPFDPCLRFNLNTK